MRREAPDRRGCGELTKRSIRWISIPRQISSTNSSCFSECIWTSKIATAIDLKHLDLDRWVKLARAKLAQYHSWHRYCDNFTISDDILEGTFSLVRYYQLEAAKAEGDVKSSVIVSPIAHRTRLRLKEKDRSLRPQQPETPTRKPTPKFTNVPGEPETPESDSEESMSSPFLSSINTVLKELENLLYPPTRDEQIVNTALVLFLNALTIHFSLSSGWTLHRRVFTANFKLHPWRHAQMDILKIDVLEMCARLSKSSRP